MIYWRAVALATSGRVARSIPLFRRVVAADPSWMELTRRLQKPGIFPAGAEGRAIIDRILRQAKP